MREINIIGMGPSALSLKNQELHGEIWGLNYAYLYRRRLDRLFVLHRWDQFMTCAQKEGRTGDHWLKAMTEGRIHQLWTFFPTDIAIPISDYPPDMKQEQAVVFTHDPKGIGNYKNQNLRKIAKSHVIDVKKIIKITQCDHLSCSLPYVIGQAIVEKVDKINLYGIEIWAWNGQNTYGGQIPSVNAMLRTAVARNIQVFMPWAEAMKINDKIFVKG